MHSTAIAQATPSRVLRVLAYSAIYVLWGASFLGIRVVVASMPPLLAAGFRFLVAGLALFLWALARKVPFPKIDEWRSALILGVGMFACDYGPLFWAEKRVASGIAAVISALIPVWIAIFEWARSRRAMPKRLLLGTVCGVGGVAALSFASGHGAQSRIEWLPMAALLFGTFAWAFGTIWSQKVPLPKSKPMAAGIQMLVGGTALTMLSFATGDARGFAMARVTAGVALAMAYLIVGASILAFTAYVWLLGHDSPTRVASYAYVNPVVAVLLGWTLGGEKLSLEIVLGMLLVLAGVMAVLGEKRGNSRERA